MYTSVGRERGRRTETLTDTVKCKPTGEQEANAETEKAVVVREPGGPTVHSPQEPSTMVPECTLGCPKHNLTCSPDSHWDALELQSFAQGYPLAFTRALTERRSLMHHLNHLYIIVL